jgi:hypothetical protein
VRDADERQDERGDRDQPNPDLAVRRHAASQCHGALTDDREAG